MSNYNNNNYNNNEGYIPSFSSAHSLRNPNGKDPTALGFSYYRKMLKLAISPALEMQADDEYQKYDTKNSVNIFLTPQKAAMLLEVINRFKENPEEFSNIGVTSGAGEDVGYVCISNGQEIGSNNIQLIIRRLDGAGNVTSSAAYEFGTGEFSTTVANFNENKKTFDNIKLPNVEFEIFISHLKEFINASTGSQAYYQLVANNKNNERLFDIHRHLLGGTKNKGSNGTSFFSNPSNGNSKDVEKSSLDDEFDDFDELPFA